MTHLEFVSRCAERSGIGEKDARAVLDAAFDTIVEEVANGGKVVVVGFGSFKPGLKRRTHKKKLVLTPSSTLDKKLS